MQSTNLSMGHHTWPHVTSKKKNIFLFFSFQFCTLGLYVKSNVVMLFCAHFICFALFILLHILLFISLFLPKYMLLCCVTISVI